MKLRLEATPDELREKSGRLIKALHAELVGISPETAGILEKALPPKEPALKYPVLRDLQRQTSEEYAKTVDRIMWAVGRVLDQSVEVAKSDHLVFVQDFDDLAKGWLCGACGAASPGEFCEHVLGANLAKSLYIGPRGGKWADSQHTIPWNPEKHGRQTAMQFEKPAPKRPVGVWPGMSLTAVEEVIYNQPVEHLVGVTSEGAGLHLVGDSSHVQVTPEALGEWEKDGDVVVTHNHPCKGPLSPEDIALAVQTNLKEMRAVSSDGSVSRMVRPDCGDWLAGVDWEGVPVGSSLPQRFMGLIEGAAKVASTRACTRMDKRIEDAGGRPGEITHAAFSQEVFNDFYKEEFFLEINETLSYNGFEWRVEYEQSSRKSETVDLGGNEAGWDHAGSAHEIPGERELASEVGEALWHSLEKAGDRPHKYIRRVPYMVGGKRKYRYYYRESALARGTREGEEIRLGDEMVRIVKVHDNGDITLEDAGADPERKVRVTERVRADAWVERLAGHYGDKFYEQVEKRARQAVGAVLRYVPRKMLADLRGDTDEARLGDLRARVPEVYDKLQKAFQRAGVNPFEAKRILQGSLRRRGWDSAARAAVIGNILDLKGARLIRRHREVMDAAENLAGGSQVGPEHAQAAVELAESNITQVAKRAESELVRLSKLLRAAQDDPSDMGKKAVVLAGTIAAKAVAQLNALATAFPGLVDRAVPVARDIVLQVPSVAPKPPKRVGAVANTFVAGEGGRPVALKARYVLKEAPEVVPSHDPVSFRRNSAYPEDLQERAYHRDKSEQHKVIRNARGMETSFVVNTNVDAVNGPPIVMKNGVVLGGNSRTMSMQRIYGDNSMAGKAEEMRKYLKDHAYEFGLNPEDIDAMEKPILVREVEIEDQSQENLQIMVRAMNESFIQAMDPRTMQVAMGRRLPERALKLLADSMEEDETLNEYLGASRSKPFLDSLHTAGIIDERNKNQYMKRGRLNADGRVMVARILAGRVLDDADLLSDTPHNLVESIAKAVPYMVQAAGSGAGYDLRDTIHVALDAFNELKHLESEGMLGRKLDKTLNDERLTQVLGNLTTIHRTDLKADHPVMADARAQAVLEVFIRRSGSRQLPSVFREFARLASANPEDQALLGDVAVRTPEEVFRLAIQASVDREAREAAEKAARKAEKERRKKEKEAQGAGLFGKSDLVEPLKYDHTKKVYGAEERGYARVQAVLERMGYEAADFGEGGPFWGWGTNQLIDFARDKRSD